LPALPNAFADLASGNSAFAIQYLQFRGLFLNIHIETRFIRQDDRLKRFTLR
jgi:hypothetical protein